MKNRLSSLLSLAQGFSVNLNHQGFNIRGRGIELWVAPDPEKGFVRIDLRAPALGIAHLETSLGKTNERSRGLSEGTYHYQDTIVFKSQDTHVDLSKITPGVTHPL